MQHTLLLWYCRYFKNWELRIVLAADGKTRKALVEYYDNFMSAFASGVADPHVLCRCV